MNNLGLWTYGSRYYEQLRAAIEMNNNGSWVQGYRRYEQLKAMEDISYSSYELRALDVMNSSWL